MNLEQLLADYEVDVDCPEVSGMEHLHTLMRRSAIATYEPHLTAAQRQRLNGADELLVRHARQFYQAIRDMADLAAWRLNQSVDAAQWWWYLDIISQLPVVSDTSVKTQPVAASQKVLEFA